MGRKPKTKRHYGNVQITTVDIPGAKNWTIGDKVSVTVELEVTGLRKPDKWEVSEEGVPAASINISSDILSVKAQSATKG